MNKPNKTTAFRLRVLTIVRAIPEGKVLAYGDVAMLAGSARAARAVGGVLKSTKFSGPQVPWQRVINAKGRISLGASPERANLQRHLLEAEGVVFDSDDAIDMKTVRWDTREAPFYGDAVDTGWEQMR